MSFEAGGAPEDVANGITLTVSMDDGDMGDGDGDMDDGDMDDGDMDDGDMDDGMSRRAARHRQRRSRGHLVLEPRARARLGALAVAMLAGARSVTGRSR